MEAELERLSKSNDEEKLKNEELRTTRKTIGLFFVLNSSFSSKSLYFIETRF
jgi:hypothetical protein